MNNLTKKMYSATEVSKILGVSRTAVFNKIKNGLIKAHKVGNNYVIDGEDILFGKNLPPNVKTDIEKVIRKAISEYGEVFKKLGKE